MSMTEAYELSKALPNKWLNPDGSITDGQGNIITPANETNAIVYQNSKSVVNKFVDVDGGTKTFEQISMDLFEPVDVLPETGEKNKIYLVPTEDGAFDEYYWTEEKGWDILGNVAIDLSNYPTIDQMNAAIAAAGTVPEVFYYTTKAHTITDTDLSFWTKIYLGNKTNDIFIYSETDAPIILLKKGTLANNKQNTVSAKYLFIRPTSNDGTTSNFRGMESSINWMITITDEVCTDATFSSSGGTDGAHYLDTRGNYSTPYIPTAPGHPATKQYVDDMVINKLGGEY